MMTHEEYVEAWGERCPACRAKTIQAAGKLEADGTVAWLPCKCSTCHAEWSDFFVLKGYEDLTTAEQLGSTPEDSHT